MNTSIRIQKEVSVEKHNDCMQSNDYTHTDAVGCVWFVGPNRPSPDGNRQGVPCWHLVKRKRLFVPPDGSSLPFWPGRAVGTRHGAE